MGIEKSVSGAIKSVHNQDLYKTDATQVTVYKKCEYKAPQLALAQHSVEYCGDGMGDGCKND
jgi:hypothetical protein